MNARVLADVQRVKMKTESPDLQGQRIKEQARHALAAIRRQTLAQQVQVGCEIRGRSISVRVPWLVARVAQPLQNVIEVLPVNLVRRARLVLAGDRRHQERITL